MNSYFPIGLRFDDKRVLLVGGGDISLFKFQKIVQFNPLLIKCVSRKFHHDFLQKYDLPVEIIQKDFDFLDLEGMDIVIVAIDDANLQKRIYEACKEKKLLCNCVDLLECCDFIFPSLVKRGHISIAINSNGLLPGLSAVLRKYIDDVLPENLDEVFSNLLTLRKNLPPGPKRMQIIRENAEKYLSDMRSRL
jgi:precorrin-2 dehydrogenase/sirohydrochlorin ferrochelatase